MIEGMKILNHLQNFSLLVYDMNGQGNSNNDYITYGKKESINLLYILKEITISFKFKYFYLWGRNVGANTIINLFYNL